MPERQFSVHQCSSAFGTSSVPPRKNWPFQGLRRYLPLAALGGLPYRPAVGHVAGKNAVGRRRLPPGVAGKKHGGPGTYTFFSPGKRQHLGALGITDMCFARFCWQGAIAATLCALKVPISTVGTERHTTVVKENERDVGRACSSCCNGQIRTQSIVQMVLVSDHRPSVIVSIHGTRRQAVCICLSSEIFIAENTRRVGTRGYSFLTLKPLLAKPRG